MKPLRSTEQHKSNTKLALEINVSIGEEFKKSLIFEKGQDPVLAASLFCEENGLKPSAVYYIQRAIEKVTADAYEIEKDHINEIDEFSHHEKGKEEEQDEDEDNINDEEEDEVDDEDGKNQNNYNNNKKKVIFTKVSRSEKKSTPTKNKKKTSIHNRRNHSEEKENIQMKSKQHRDKSPIVVRTQLDQIDNFGARMYNQELARQQTKQKKLQEMQKHIEEVNLLEATFKPTINLNSQLIIQRMDLQGQKEKMDIRKIARMDQIRIERECKQQAACTFQPQIGAVSQRIGQFAKHSREEHDVFSHLYLDSFKRQKEAELKEEAQSEAIAERIRMECPFQPEINFTPNLIKNMADFQMIPIDQEDNKNISSQSLVLSNGQTNTLGFNRRNTDLDQYQIYEEYKPNRKDMSFQMQSDQISSPLFQQGRQQEMKQSIRQKLSFTQSEVNSQQHQLQQSGGKLTLSLKDSRDSMCSSDKKQMNSSAGRDLAAPFHHSFQQYQSISSIKSKNSNIIAPLMTNEDDFMDSTLEKGLISLSPRIASPECIIPNFEEINHKSTPIKLIVKYPQTQDYSEPKNNNNNQQQKVQYQVKSTIPEVDTPRTERVADGSEKKKEIISSSMSSSTGKTVGTQDNNQEQNILHNSKGLVSVWDELYVDAIHQHEKQQLAEIRAREYPEQLSKIKKISPQSDAIAKEQRNRLVECMFEALDGKQLGYLSSTNLSIDRLSDEISRIHKPLFNAIIESQRNFNEVTFQNAAKQFYKTINYQDLLTLSTLLSAKISNYNNNNNNKYSLNERPNRLKKVSKTGIHQSKEGYPLAQACKTCCDTLEIMETLDKMKTDHPITSQ